uniref:uncharacterized protein LOC118541084 n=1 Tax=Halichoerus grypus TaxID=9711 RepID=UPI001658F486|nr:uncharacterized protein LOC118541084 [Halichoerus grypus]
MAPPPRAWLGQSAPAQVSQRGKGPRSGNRDALGLVSFQTLAWGPEPAKPAVSPRPLSCLRFCTRRASECLRAPATARASSLCLVPRPAASTARCRAFRLVSLSSAAPGVRHVARRRHSDENDGGQPHKRRKTSDANETEDHLESLICKVGEKSACSLESNLEGLAGVLEADLPNYKSKILRLLCTVYVCKRFMNPVHACYLRS